MNGCKVDLAAKEHLTNYIDNELGGSGERRRWPPTTAFQRVIRRAVIHVQSSGREEVTGANVLLAIFAEPESDATHFLQEQGLSRYDAVEPAV
jgi:ATP-dependent Clp protease ATP-binding subunit ClpA